MFHHNFHMTSRLNTVADVLAFETELSRQNYTRDRVCVHKASTGETDGIRVLVAKIDHAGHRHTWEILAGEIETAHAA